MWELGQGRGWMGQATQGLGNGIAAAKQHRDRNRSNAQGSSHYSCMLKWLARQVGGLLWFAEGKPEDG